MARALSKTLAFSVDGVISDKGFYNPGRFLEISHMSLEDL